MHLCYVRILSHTFLMDLLCLILQRNRGKRPVTDAELIHDEIEQQVSRCQCRKQFKCQKVGEGKYKVLFLKI